MKKANIVAMCLGLTVKLNNNNNSLNNEKH